ncbi:hypothetical protein [Celeribacter indicus]|uniref:hypothetical protein n=1 Tax=Celeribacter indicus TaxID=1208324 RepID=UPI001114EB7B|nr:hypothetical protein [Celeribacter indicus]
MSAKAGERTGTSSRRGGRRLDALRNLRLDSQACRFDKMCTAWRRSGYSVVQAINNIAWLILNYEEIHQPIATKSVDKILEKTEVGFWERARKCGQPDG